MGESSVSDYFADISIQEACMVTQELDLDQVSETLKGAYIYIYVHTERCKYDKTFLLQISGLFASYDPAWMIIICDIK